MEYENFPKIGFGTWTMGGDVAPNPNNDDKRDIEAIKYVISKGVSHIDTAANYADGKSEELVGRAIKDFDREKLFIATKVKPEDLAFDDVIKSCERSLKNLDTPWVDLLYVHKPNPEIEIKETAKAFNELLKRGVIKNVGLSNVKLKTILEYEKYLDKPVFAIQNQYNLVARESQEKGIVDFCRENKKIFVAWRPIHLMSPSIRKILGVGDEFPLLEEMAKKYNKTEAQIAVKWLTQQEGVSVIFKSTNKEHIDEILEAENFELSKEDWHRLDKDFPIKVYKSFNGSGFFELL